MLWFVTRGLFCGYQARPIVPVLAQPENRTQLWPGHVYKLWCVCRSEVNLRYYSSVAIHLAFWRQGLLLA